MRQLIIYWWRGSSKIRIGRLGERLRSPIIFEWDKEFLSKAIELSPLKLRKSSSVVECPREPFDGLPGLFADCIPDGWGRILLKIGLAKKGITSTEISPLDALAYIGDRGIGALSFEPDLRDSEKWAEGRISLTDLDRGIQPILEGTPSAVIETYLQNAASPNGMRPKILLKEQAGRFYSPQSSVEGDEWLIKFRAPSDPVSMGKLEFIYSKMAQAAGLDIPETRLFKSSGKHYFGVKRFDRTAQGRTHVHTLSGILNIHPGNYSVGYDHFAKVAQVLSADFREVEKVLQIAAFNVFASNQDDHSKNVAFLMNPEGKWSVAPAYDLTFHTTPYSQHKMPIFQNGQPSEADLLALGKEFGLANKKCSTIIEQVKEGVMQFKTLAQEYELPKAVINEVGKVLDQKLVSAKAIARVARKRRSSSKDKLSTS